MTNLTIGEEEGKKQLVDLRRLSLMASPQVISVSCLSPNGVSLMQFASRSKSPLRPNHSPAGRPRRPRPSMVTGGRNDDDALPYKKPRVMSIRRRRQIMWLELLPFTDQSTST